MKIKKEDVIATVVGTSLALWLLGIPQGLLEWLQGKPATIRLYVPSGMKRISNPGNVNIADLREETDRD